MYIYIHRIECISIYLYLYTYIYIYISISISVSMSISISTYVYIYTCDICVTNFYMTSAGSCHSGRGLCGGNRPTETPCGISSHVVASSQFRGPVLKTPTVWLGLGLIASTNSSGYLLTPMWTLQQLVLRSMTEAYPKC